MTKKKKSKSKAQSVQSQQSRSSPAVIKTPTKTENENRSLKKEDVIILNISSNIPSLKGNKNVSNNNSIAKRNDLRTENERILHLQPDDALSLNVVNGDHVLILQVAQNGIDKDAKDNNHSSMHGAVTRMNTNYDTQIIWDSRYDEKSSLITQQGNDQPRFVAVCKVKVLLTTGGTGSTPSKQQQNYNNYSKNSSQKMKCNQAKIDPYPLSQKLFESPSSNGPTMSPITPSVTSTPQQTNTLISKTDDEPNSNTVTASAIRTPQSSSSKSKFSFAIGGGGDTIISSPPPKPQSSSSSSSSKSKFSFARGRGGDTLIQSPCTPTLTAKRTTPMSHSFHTPSPSSTRNSKFGSKSSSRQSYEIAVISLKLHVDKLSKTALLGDASNIILRLKEQITVTTTIAGSPVSPPSSSSSSSTTTTKSSNILHSSLKKAERVLEQMVIACCSYQYVTLHDIITISFQGKRLQFEVIQMTGKTLPAFHYQNVIQSMSQLKLEEEEKIDDDDRSYILQSLISQIDLFSKKSEEYSNNQKILQRITPDTTFEFSFNDNPPSSPSINKDKEKTGLASNSSSYSSSRPKNSQSKTKQENMPVLAAGMDAIMKGVHAILDPPLLYPHRFPRTGPIRAPRGILLYGSSGVGKTLLANQLANDFQRMFHQNENIINDNSSSTSSDDDEYKDETKMKKVETTRINCAEIQSFTSIIGDAEGRLTRIFEHAEKRAINEGVSTMIILDDVHLICAKRGVNGSAGGSDRVASTLLALLDGIGLPELNRQTSNQDEVHDKTMHPGNVVVLATTSNPSLLDPALRRSGRLDSEVEIPIPDDEARSQIFSYLLEGLRNDNIVLADFLKSQCMVFARQAKGFTGADCVLAVKEAVRSALTKFKKSGTSSSKDICLEIEDLQHAIRITKPSSIKSITVEIPRVPWSAIGGMENVKQCLREAIELPITHSHLFSALGISPPRGVLLYGPPGCSKTLMARALATESNMNFLAVKGPELLSKWLGESERALAALFRRARMASPCVIFFDEIDAIASKRGSGGSSGGGERMLSQLLTELDGVSIPNGTNSVGDTETVPKVVIVGATNRPDLLDDALTRPGRIDRMIHVGVPDEQSRKEIFKVTLKSKACDGDIDFEALASKDLTEGYSGAEIVGICRDAALFAIEEGDKPDSRNVTENKSSINIHMRHILLAIKGTKRQITPKMLQFYESFGSNK